MHSVPVLSLRASEAVSVTLANNMSVGTHVNKAIQIWWVADPPANCSSISEPNGDQLTCHLTQNCDPKKLLLWTTKCCVVYYVVIIGISCYVICGVLFSLIFISPHSWQRALMVSRGLLLEETTANGGDCLFVPLLFFTITLRNFCLLNMIISVTTPEKGKSRKESLVPLVSSYNITGHWGLSIWVYHLT